MRKKTAFQISHAFTNSSLGHFFIDLTAKVTNEHWPILDIAA